MTQDLLAQDLAAEREANRKVAEEFSATWDSLITVQLPLQQFLVWMSQFEPAVIRYGIRETASKFSRARGQMSEDYLIRFCSKTMKNKTGRLQPQIQETA